MAVITPTLTLTSNASTASTNPGPLSVALSLSATDVLTVDTIEAATITVGTTVQTLFDGSTKDVGSEVAGTNGGFLYFKNTSAADHDVYIGIEADGASATELQGNADAQYYLGLAYANGFGLKESLVKAYMWFNISAKINNNAKIAIKSLEKMMDQILLYH